MARTNRRNRTGFALAVVAGVLGAGCSHFSGLHWPWSHKAPPAPTPVNELILTTDSGAAASYLQYWKRNTLLIDLHDASQEGSIAVKPRPGAQWPVRIAFRVTPGSIGILEVRGEERVVMPVSVEAGTPIDLELVPGIYIATTVQLKVHWSAR
jgi:hypothetical protein